MSVILSLETSTEVCSVALHQNDVLVKEIVIRETQAHAEKLAPAIEKLLSGSDLSISLINAVAISSGPGSYTGLRIGTSTAKGICYAMNIPLIAVSTLKLLAYQAKNLSNKDTLLCPMIDARRMEVYAEIFSNDLTSIRPVQAEVIDENSYQELLSSRPMLFFGNGALKCKTVIKHSNAGFIDDVFPSATKLGELAYDKFSKGQYEDLEHYKPFYLKDFVAKKAKPLLS